MHYLQQRSSGYYFRLRIPSDLQQIIGIIEIKRSLQTRSLKLAKETAYLISGRLKKLFRMLRRRNLKLTKDVIADIINEYIQEGIRPIEDGSLPLTPSTPFNLCYVDGHLQVSYHGGDPKRVLNTADHHMSKDKKVETFTPK